MLSIHNLLLSLEPVDSEIRPYRLKGLGFDIGSLIVRIWFWAHYTTVIIRNLTIAMAIIGALLVG